MMRLKPHSLPGATKASGFRRRNKTAPTFDYIAVDNYGAVVRVDELFSDAAARLAAHPSQDWQGGISGRFELIPHKSYCLMR